jgi:mannitol/fructose-specific phosphotransferase system IIA component (Ntr-type)
MNLEHFLSKEQIVQIKATEKQPAIRELVSHLSDMKLIENKERAYAQIIHRESIENTGIGHGLAIPHARSERLGSFVTIFGISREPIDYQSYDEEPVRFICLSLFPTEQSTKYLYFIGMLARLFANPEKRAAFEELTAPSKVHTLLKREMKEYFEGIADREDEEPEASVNLASVPSTDLDLLIRLDRLFNLKESGENSPGIETKIKDLKKLIDNRSLLYYERMKKKKDNPFAIVEKGSCSGCHLETPPMEVNRIQEGTGLVVCPHCGRFLMQL